MAGATETDTTVTDAVSGRSARAYRSAYAETMEPARGPLPAFQQMHGLTEPQISAVQDDIASFHLYGQAARLNRPVPASDLVRLLIDKTKAAFASLRPGGQARDIEPLRPS